MNLKQRKFHLYHCLTGDILRFTFDKCGLTHAVLYIEELVSKYQWKYQRRLQTPKTLTGKVHGEEFSHTD